jgi:prolyl-tRNA synthetase
MRWEMRTRLFLRTAEFLWQEGHTAHATAEEGRAETLAMLDVYARFAEDFLAIPVIKGRKTDSEKFPGAEITYAIEGLMQDGKALQCGTSHDLGQNFAKAFDIKFLGKDQQQHHVWTTSWGVSTRLIGALVMAHSDDDGLVLPPRVAPVVAAIVPIFKTDEERAKVRAFIDRVLTALVGAEEVAAAKTRSFANDLENYFFDRVTHQRIVVDWGDQRPGEKHFRWEQQGAPFRIEVGPRDVDGGTFVVKHRLDREKESVSLDAVSPAWLRARMNAAQTKLFERARAFRDANTRRASSYDEMKAILAKDGGFVRCWFAPDGAVEGRVKEETKATVRCIPLEQPGGQGRCIVTGKDTSTEVLFAQAY